MVISCDRCNARLDLGPAMGSPYGHRNPSGWLATGENNHLCTICAPHATSVFARR